MSQIFGRYGEADILCGLDVPGGLRALGVEVGSEIVCDVIVRPKVNYREMITLTSVAIAGNPTNKLAFKPVAVVQPAPVPKPAPARVRSPAVVPEAPASTPVAIRAKSAGVDDVNFTLVLHRARGALRAKSPSRAREYLEQAKAMPIHGADQARQLSEVEDAIEQYEMSHRRSSTR